MTGESLVLDNEAMPKRIERQTSLQTSTNPNAGIDYVCALTAQARDGYARVDVRYVPDKLLITTEAFEYYLHSFEHGEVSALESFALAVLDDLNNELVPRWLQIRVTADEKGLDRGHRVMIEDRQPKWDNPALLANIERF